MRWKKHGDPLSGGPSRERLPQQCVVPDCTQAPSARGMCPSHWRRWKLYGDPLADRTRKPQQCSIENCGKPVEGRGWCSKHYDRWRAHGDPMSVAFIRGDDEARFWSYVDKNGPIPARCPDLGPCWVWTGPTDYAGYGRITVGGTEVKAARYICGLKLGAIPDGHEPDHLCKNTGCVNYISHLEVVTQRVNILRSDNPAAINARKTYCIHNHEFTPGNTIVAARPDGRVRRSCRECSRDAGRRHREKVRALRHAAESRAA